MSGIVVSNNLSVDYNPEAGIHVLYEGAGKVSPLCGPLQTSAT